MRSQDFWQKFGHRTYEKQAITFNRDDFSIQFTEKEIFEMVCKCCAIKKAGKLTHGYLRLYIDNIETTLDRNNLKLLPQSSDSCFEDYHRRVKKILKKKRYYLIIGDFHAYDANAFVKLYRGVACMAPALGLSRRRIDTQIFIGDSSKTPFGIHVDEASVFHIPVVGKKKIRFWESEEINKNSSMIGKIDYKNHTKNSFFLNAGVGQVLYWPSRLWHVAENEGKFGVTWGLGWWSGDNCKIILRKNFEKVMAEIDTNSKVQSIEPTSILKKLSQSPTYAAFETFYTKQSKALLTQLAIDHLKTYSAMGFWTIPDLNQLTKAQSLAAPIYFYNPQKIENYIFCLGDVLQMRSKKLFDLLFKWQQNQGKTVLRYEVVDNVEYAKLKKFLSKKGILLNWMEK